MLKWTCGLGKYWNIINNVLNINTKLGAIMDIEKLKTTIETTKTVKNLWKIGEKIFAKNDNAICAVTYLIERAYELGKQEVEKRIIPIINIKK